MKIIKFLLSYNQTFGFWFPVIPHNIYSRVLKHYKNKIHYEFFQELVARLPETYPNVREVSKDRPCSCSCLWTEHISFLGFILYNDKEEEQY